MTERATAGFTDVGSVEDFPLGEMRVAIPERDVWVMRAAADRFYALRNRCPHRSGPICMGRVDGTCLPSAPGVYEFGLEFRVIRCPRHGYEFDLETGQQMFSRETRRVVRYEVVVDGDRVLVSSKGK